MKALTHLVKKEFIQISRTRAMLVISLGVPIVQLLILGFAITGDVIHVPAAVIDLDNSATSRSLVSKLENTRYLDVRYRLNDIRKSAPLLQHGDVILSVSIPLNFEQKIVRGERAEISVSADGQNSNVALTGTGYVLRIIQSWNRTHEISGMKTPVTFNIINLESRVWYNPELKNVFFMVPGILVLLVTIITIILTAMAIVREREVGTLEQLMVTPISRVELILGKTIPFAILGILELSFALCVAKAVYGIIIAGSLPLFFCLSLLYIFCTLGIGILISTISHTQQQALFTAWFVMIFCIIMSGFFLPLENMPRLMYYLTYINPLRYFMTIVRELFLKGSGIHELWHQAAVLLMLTIIVMTTAVVRFHKRLG